MRETTSVNNEKTKGLTQEPNKKDRRNAVRRWSFIDSNNINYGTLRGTGYAWSIAKTLREIYPNDDDYVGAMRAEYEHLNITPYMGPLVTGTDAALQRRQGTESLGAIRSIKASLIGPLSGIGDSLLWVLYPTIMRSINDCMALEGNPLGAIIQTILNLGLVRMRLKLFDLGYEPGICLVTDMVGKLNTITESASVMGLAVAGSLTATVVKAYMPVESTFSEITMGSQAEIFDHILPALLPALLTTLVYFLMEKKKWGSLKVISLLLTLSLLGAYFDFLGVTP